MKASIEYLVTFLLIMAGILGAFNFYTVYQQNHRAHAFRDQVANLIENYDGDIEKVEMVLMEESLCRSCRYDIRNIEDFLVIDVSYDLMIQVFNLKHEVQIKGLSYLP